MLLRHGADFSAERWRLRLRGFQKTGLCARFICPCGGAIRGGRTILTAAYGGPVGTQCTYSSASAAQPAAPDPSFDEVLQHPALRLGRLPVLFSRPIWPSWPIAALPHISEIDAPQAWLIAIPNCAQRRMFVPSRQSPSSGKETVPKTSTRNRYSHEGNTRSRLLSAIGFCRRTFTSLLRRGICSRHPRAIPR